MRRGREHAKGHDSQFRWLGYVQIMVVLGVVAVALYIARAPERIQREAVLPLAPADTKPLVRVLHPSRTGQSLTIELTGTVGLSERANVNSEVAGRVIWVSPKFSSGGHVEANETIVMIDPASYERQARLAELAVTEAESQVEVEVALSEEAVRSFAAENPGVEPSRWERREPFIELAEARLARARAKADMARLQLGRTRISLPYPSRVIGSRIEVGEYVDPDVAGQPPLGIVYRVSALEIDAPVELSDLEYLKPVIGRSALVRTPGGSHEARVARVSSVVDPRSRLATVFLRFDQGIPPESLPLPGTFATIAIAGSSHEGVFVLPESALQEQDKVWVVREGVLRGLSPRMLGRTGEGWVVDGFDSGEGVVVGALPGARDGLAVTVMPAEPAE